MIQALENSESELKEMQAELQTRTDELNKLKSVHVKLRSLLAVETQKISYCNGKIKGQTAMLEGLTIQKTGYFGNDTGSKQKEMS